MDIFHLLKTDLHTVFFREVKSNHEKMNYWTLLIFSITVIRFGEKLMTVFFPYQ